MLAVLYIDDDSNTLLVVFENGVQKWIHFINIIRIDDVDLAFSSGSIDSILLLEAFYPKIRVHFCEEDSVTDYCIKPIRNTTFQNLKLIYVWSHEEIWVQDLENNIKIYRFDASISAIENFTSIERSMSEKSKLGLILSYKNYFRLGEFIFKDNHGELVLFRSRISKASLPDLKIKAFYNIKVYNYESKNVDDGIMLHYKDTLILLSVMSGSIKYEIKRTLKKENVVTFRNNSCIFFWENKSDGLEMLKLPFNPNNVANVLQKVYEADVSLVLVKATIVDDEEYLYVVDEPKHFKLLKVEETKVTVYKNFYVNNSFASYFDSDVLEQITYCNGMIYDKEDGYILQEKRKEIDDKFTSLRFNSYGFKEIGIKFPMYTEELMLSSLDPFYLNNYSNM